jgi:hypothetical protein
MSSDNTLDLEIFQGSNFSYILTISDENEDPIDLTGYTFRGQARVKYNSPSAAFSFTFALQNQTTNTGKVSMTLDDSDLESLPILDTTKYLYDVEMVSADGTVTKILRGTAKVIPQVTK